MKTKTIAFLTALLLVVLTGCNNAPPNEDKPQPFSFSESSQNNPESEVPVGNESKEVETTPEAMQEAEPEKQKETTEKDTVSTEQPQTVSDTEQAAQPAGQLNQADKTEHSVSTPQPGIPEESKAPESTAIEEVLTETQPNFDIDYWISFAKDYAIQIGLELDSEAIYCWDNPITANTKRSGIDDDIQSRLNRYKNVEGVTAVWVWVEKVSGAEYEIYIGYR